MKVLFLDVDGVLNRDGTKERCMGYVGIDRELSEKLIAWRGRNPDVEIVLSSTWRYIPGMKAGLMAAGIDWISETPHHMGSRGDEISLWLYNAKRNDIVYVILDDVMVNDNQLERFVQTDPSKGLEDHHLDKLTELFK